MRRLRAIVTAGLLFFLPIVLSQAGLGVATAGGEIHSGETILSGVYQQGGVDETTFYGAAGDRVVISAVANLYASLNTDIDLFSPSQMKVGDSDSRDRLDVVLAETGIHTIKVSDFNLTATGEYWLGLLKMPAGRTFSITSGQTATGAIQLHAGADAFQFSGQAGDVIIVRTMYAVGASPRPTPHIDVYSPSWTKSSLPLWGGTTSLTETGTFTLSVWNESFSQSGQYYITLQKVPGADPSQGDPDGGTVVAGQTRVGAINLPTDVDAYQFSGRAGDNILIRAVDPSAWKDTKLNAWHSLEYFLRLYAPSNALEAETPLPGEGSPWMGERPQPAAELSPKLKETGAYTVLIWMYNQSGYASNDTGAYSIRYITDGDAPGFPLPASPATGSLDGTPGVRKVYQVPLSPYQQLDTSLTASSPGSDFVLELFGPGTTNVEAAVPVASTAGSGSQLAMAYKAPRGLGGTYSLLVGNAGSVPSPYTLKWRIINPAFKVTLGVRYARPLRVGAPIRYSGRVSPVALAKGHNVGFQVWTGSSWLTRWARKVSSTGTYSDRPFYIKRRGTFKIRMRMPRYGYCQAGVSPTVTLVAR